jgi:uncharacterized protein with PIN domain
MNAQDVTLVRCPECQNVLGKLSGDVLVIRHKKREMATHSAIYIRCEQCGGVWFPASQRGNQAA